MPLDWKIDSDDFPRQRADLSQGGGDQFLFRRRPHAALVAVGRQLPHPDARGRARRAAAHPHDADDAVDRSGRDVLRALPRDRRRRRARRVERRRDQRRLGPRRAARHRAAWPGAKGHRADGGAVPRSATADRRAAAALRPSARPGARGRRPGDPARAAAGFEFHLAQSRRRTARPLRLARLSHAPRRAADLRAIWRATIACCCASPARSSSAGASTFAARRPRCWSPARSTPTTATS